MKRKLLLEFADYLERSRKPFSITNAEQCVSFQACRFNGEVNNKNLIIVNSRGEPGASRLTSDDMDLVRIFDMSSEQASQIYSKGFSWDRAGDITRKVAAGVIRKLARTGEVDWGDHAMPPVGR